MTRTSTVLRHTRQMPLAVRSSCQWHWQSRCNLALQGFKYSVPVSTPAAAASATQARMAARPVKCPQWVSISAAATETLRLGAAKLEWSHHAPGHCAVKRRESAGCKSSDDHTGSTCHSAVRVNSKPPARRYCWQFYAGASCQCRNSKKTWRLTVLLRLSRGLWLHGEWCRPEAADHQCTGCARC